MPEMTDVAIIGAGPYGLSLATHLAEAAIDVTVFGSPMQFWRTNMPEPMVLKSEGFASNLWHPRDALTLKDFCAQHSLPYQDSGLPVPLQTFIDYGLAFQKRFVPMLNETPVTSLRRDRGLFKLRLRNGSEVQAERVVLATGIGSFRHLPPELDAIAGPLCTHSAEHRSLDRFIEQEVLVIGGGASGVEMAAMIAQQGGRVTLATRQDRVAFCGPPQPTGLLEQIRAPESGLGTGWRSLACVAAPMLFYHMPEAFRHMVVRKHLGPAPGWTSRKPFEKNVRAILGARLLGSATHNHRVYVDFALPDGTKRTVEADHVIAATGFKVDMHRLDFISPEIMGMLRLADDTPVLSPHFETSVPGLFTVGVTAANCFGPLLRFAYGAKFASRRLSRYLAETSEMPALARTEPVPA